MSFASGSLMGTGRKWSRHSAGPDQRSGRVNGAFELELSQEGLYRFYVVGQTGYDRKTFSDETALRRNGKELVLVYRVGDEEQKAQETARVEEAIARRKQEKEQWGTVLSGRESSSLSGLPELTQPGTDTVRRRDRLHRRPEGHPHGLHHGPSAREVRLQPDGVEDIYR